MIEVRKRTMEEFMGLYIDFWQFLYLKSNLRIKKKEREFMVHTLVLNAKGVDISGKEYVKEIIDRMDLRSDNEVYNYRSRLKNKGFLIKNGSAIELPQALNVKEVPRETFFQFKAICDEPTALANQKPVRQINKMGDLDRPVKKPVRPKLPEYEQRLPRVEQEQRFKPTPPEEEVELPPVYNIEPKEDPLKEVSKAIGSFVNQNKNEIINNAYVKRANTGYSSTEYQEFTESRDRDKLPPIPGFDDENAPEKVEDSKYYAPPVNRKRSIINLDD